MTASIDVQVHGPGRPIATTRLDTLQAGRAIAAFIVVLYHLNGSIFGKAKYFPDQIHPIFGAGHAGVEFFFVLSGFLMAWLYGHRLGRPEAVWPFLKKRFLRIYPVYWVVLTALIPMYFLIPGVGEGYETQPLSILTSYLLIPTPQDPILQVAWTLRFEIFFYLMFSALMAWPRLMLPVFGLWAAGAAAHLFFRPGFPLYFFFNPLILLFLFGAVAAGITRRGFPRPGLVAALGVLGFIGFMIGEVYFGFARNLCVMGYGLSATTAVAGLVRLEQAGRITVPRWLSYQGDMSYALYLVHFPVLSLGIKTVFAANLDLVFPQAVIALFLVAACLLAAFALHELFERRLLLRSWRANVLTRRKFTG